MKKLLIFHASWCGPCKVYTRLIREFKEKHPEVNINDYDVDDNEEQVQRYGVRGVPTTIIVDESGNEITRKSGIIQESELLELLK